MRVCFSTVVVVSALIALANLLVTTSSYKFSARTADVSRCDLRYRRFQLLSRSRTRSYQLEARKSKKTDNNKDDDEEAKWDDDLDGTNNQMIIHGEDDVIATGEWSSKTSPVGG
jgi:hypothetical protein